MSENTTVAISYAKAVHDLCADAAQAKHWSETLTGLSAVAQNADMVAFLGDEARSRADRLAGFIKVVEGAVDEKALNLVRLLGERDRLDLLPEVAAEFEKLRAEGERRIVASVVSAKPLTDEQSNQIKTALGKRLDRTVELETTVDEDLIGGAIVRAGDLVIDGSMRGELEHLAVQMSR
ncbi:F0F1 ATP synthase subunit delta [Guyparkeria sp. SCN-R1]|uniref:F0F1 ATP synthase subunit delta n=1 Tax=Guyparkeria sp. SCN-R1 TaxID=2341113 RepID=UPI000F64F9D7|nr:F0F1 ATP synthase subunit delta [Guyparkeria sp. SCN-R1]RRQ24403.1 F0F1 ATP synthase subunit delta [Guyparkeria sp. SCN-R1]